MGSPCIKPFYIQDLTLRSTPSSIDKQQSRKGLWAGDTCPITANVNLAYSEDKLKEDTLA